MTLSFGGGAGVLTIPGLTSDTNDGIIVEGAIQAHGLSTLGTLELVGDNTDGSQLLVRGVDSFIALNVEGDGSLGNGIGSWGIGPDGTLVGSSVSVSAGLFAAGGLGVWGGGEFNSQPVLATGAGKTADDIIALLQSYGLCKQA